MKTNKTERFSVRTMTLAALMLALCLVLPFLTGQIPQIGSMLSPMHLPVLLCGFLCGWQYAAVVGFVAPLLRFLLFGMPPIFPTGITMCFELCVYGLVVALVWRFAPAHNLGTIFLALLAAMLAGRVAGGLVRALLTFTGVEYSLQAFFTAYFVTAIPAIVLQLVLIPVVVLALQRAKIIV